MSIWRKIQSKLFPESYKRWVQSSRSDAENYFNDWLKAGLTSGSDFTSKQTCCGDVNCRDKQIYESMKLTIKPVEG